MTCKCVCCPMCNGSGSIWVDVRTGRAIDGCHDDLDDLETCPECRGAGISETCEECEEGDGREWLEMPEEITRKKRGKAEIEAKV